MARKGYAIEGQYPSRILNLLSEDKPGIRWSELRRRSGISKPTFAKYLKLLVASKYVLQEDGFFRANPTRKIVAVESKRAFETSHRERSMELQRWAHPEMNQKVFLDESGRQWPYSIVAKWREEFFESMSDPTKFREWVDAEIARISIQFILALDEIVRLPKKAAAREYIDLFLKVDVIPMLHGCARDIWEHRNRIPVRSLDGYVAHLQAGEKYLRRR